MANKLIMGCYTNTPAAGAGTVAEFLDLRSVAGATLLVRRSFNSGMPATVSATEAAGDAAAGIVTFLSCLPAMTGTADDAKIASLAASLPSGSYLTAHHEPEAPKKNISGPQFVAMFQHFYSIAKAANPNIHVGPTYMTYQWGAGRKVVTPDDWWVGAGFCDFIATDSYMQLFQGTGSPKVPVPLSADPDHLRWHTWAKSKNKPLIVTENGVDKGYTDQQRADYYLANETWMISQGYRMLLPWNGYLTPGASYDFYRGDVAYPITVAAFTAIVGRGQTDAVLTPTAAPTAGFVDATAVTADVVSSQPVVLPAGLQGGDGIYLWIAYATSASTPTVMTPPAGFTVPPSSGSKSSTISANGIAVELLYRTAAGTVGAPSTDAGRTVTVGVSQQVKVSVEALGYRNVTVAPLSVAFAADAQVSATAHGPTPTVTPSPASYVLEFFSGRTPSASNTSYSTPGGTTKRSESYYASTFGVDSVVFGSGAPVSSGGGHSTTAAQPATYEVYATVVLVPAGAGTWLPPSISAVDAAPGTNPTDVTVTLTEADPASGTLTNTIHWGDGVTTVTTATSVTHTYPAPGSYSVTVTAASSVSARTSSVFTQLVQVAALGGVTPLRGYPLPLTGQRVAGYMQVLREQLLPSLDIDVDSALRVPQQQATLLRGWNGVTTDPATATGTVALTGGNIYWWEIVGQIDDNVTGVDMEVTSALTGGTGTVLTLRDDQGATIVSASADTALGSTGLRRIDLPTTSGNAGDVFILSLYLPSGRAATLRAAPASATTISLGSSPDHRISVVAAVGSNPSALDLTAGSAAGLALLSLR